MTETRKQSTLKIPSSSELKPKLSVSDEETESWRQEMSCPTWNRERKSSTQTHVFWIPNGHSCVRLDPWRVCMLCFLSHAQFQNTCRMAARERDFNNKIQCRPVQPTKTIVLACEHQTLSQQGDTQVLSPLAITCFLHAIQNGDLAGCMVPGH